MGTGQVVEVPDELVDLSLGVERLQHVAANKVVEVVHGLHGDGLVEEFHGLLGLDPQASAELLSVLRKSVADRRAPVAEPAPEGSQVGTHIGEVVGIDRVVSATTKKRSGCPWPGSRARKTWARVTVVP